MLLLTGIAFSSRQADAMIRRLQSTPPWLRFSAALFFCVVMEALGALAFVQDRLTTWWPSLDHPPWAPPLWAWMVVGLLFNALATAVLYRTWGAWSDGKSPVPFVGMAAVVVANQLWAGAFFGLESPLAGFISLFPYAVLAAWESVLLWRVDRSSALLFVPYLFWIAFDFVWTASLAGLL